MIEGHPPPLGLGLIATVDRVVWPSGVLITGVLDVTNTAVEGRLVFRAGSPAIGTLSTLSGTPVGNDRRPYRGVGRSLALAPGDSTTIRFVSGSSNLDRTARTTLAPGEYLLVVHLRISIEDSQDLLAAPPIPIRLEAP